jgi:hypothetical protein
VESE